MARGHLGPFFDRFAGGRCRVSEATTEERADEPWTVGILARLAKCTLRAIRFYEQRGLLRTPERTEGRHRRYNRGDLERLRAIAELRRGGLTIDQVQHALELRRRHTAGASAAHELDQMLEQRIRALSEHLDQLNRLRSEFLQLQRALQPCKLCRDPSYLNGCATCEKLSAFASDSALRILWNHEL